MFNHVFLGTNDIEKSRSFYDKVMGALGFEGHALPHGTVYPAESGSLIVAKPANGESATVSNGHTLSAFLDLDLTGNHLPAWRDWVVDVVLRAVRPQH